MFPKKALTFFSFQITSLKKDIEAGDELVITLRKQSTLDKEESIYVCDELNNEIMDLDVSFTTRLVEMGNRGEGSQILSGLTFDRNDIF